MPAAIEQHAEWITDCITHMRQHGLDRIEATPEAMGKWLEQVNTAANATLLPLATSSWYLGANVPGKPRVFMPYAGGMARYRQICNDIAANSYEGFALNPCNGATQRLQLLIAGPVWPPVRAAGRRRVGRGSGALCSGRSDGRSGHGDSAGTCRKTTPPELPPRPATGVMPDSRHRWAILGLNGMQFLDPLQRLRGDRRHCAS